MSNSTESMSDLVRSIMYGGAEGGENLYAEVISLAEKLAEEDGVPFNHESNRLVMLSQYVRLFHRSQWEAFEHLNDNK